MAESKTALQDRRFGETQRRESWWTEVLPIIIVFGGFGIYATLRAFEGAFYEWGPYLSPFYSPLIDPEHKWLPMWLSPALLILGAPLGFRTTCYYYRKAYYRSFFMSPPSCAVTGRAAGRYSGERKYSLHSAKPASLLPLFGADLHRRAVVRRAESLLVC